MLHDIQVIPKLFITFDNLFQLITIISLIIYMIRRVVCADNTGADQPVYPRSLINTFYLRICE